MRVTKLVTGILSCVIFAVVMFQSCAAGVVESLDGSDGSAAGAGMITGGLMLAAGIVSIVSRKNPSGGGTIAGMVLYLIAGLIGCFGHGIYEDLQIWGGLCLAFAIVLLVFQIRGKKREEQ